MPTTLIVKLVSAVIGVAALVGAYFFWQHQIQLTQQLKDTNKQLIQTQKDMAELKEKTKKIESAQSDILLELSRKNQAVVIKQDTVREYLQSPQAQASNRESSEVLKETIRRLREN